MAAAEADFGTIEGLMTALDRASSGLAGGQDPRCSEAPAAPLIERGMDFAHLDP